MGWGQYWKERNHKRKALCSDFISIDSLSIFNKRNQGISDFNVDDEHELQATLMEDGFRVSTKRGTYIIPIEKQICNGCHFFHCPARNCNRRMRKLYYFQGLFLCRKCLNLSYHSQRISPIDRKPPLL